MTSRTINIEKVTKLIIYIGNQPQNTEVSLLLLCISFSFMTLYFFRTPSSSHFQMSSEAALAKEALVVVVVVLVVVVDQISIQMTQNHEKSTKK